MLPTATRESSKPSSMRCGRGVFCLLPFSHQLAVYREREHGKYVARRIGVHVSACHLFDGSAIVQDDHDLVFTGGQIGGRQFYCVPCQHIVIKVPVRSLSHALPVRRNNLNRNIVFLELSLIGNFPAGYDANCLILTIVISKPIDDADSIVLFN